MAKIKRDLSKEAEEWFTDNIGYMPKERILGTFIDENPGWGLLLHHILDPQKYYQDGNTDRKREKNEANRRRT